MLIKPDLLEHWITNFYGYGSWKSKIWFVGYEEGGGEQPEEVAEKFNFFNTSHGVTVQPTLCDIREMYKHVAFRINAPRGKMFTTLYEYRFADDAGLHGSWKNLISFAHGFKNEKLPDLLSYQKSNFASASSNEALIQLYPLPSSHNHAWYYSWLDLPQFPFLKTRAAYQDHLYENRINSILNNIKTHKPEVVVLYGMDNINLLKESVQKIFPSAKFKMIKAVKLQLPQHHRAEIDGTIIVLTTQIPALRHNRIESGFDWQLFGQTVKSI